MRSNDRNLRQLVRDLKTDSRNFARERAGLALYGARVVSCCEIMTALRVLSNFQ
jgi:hypothetical protein